jgi:hypothetical protein
MESRRCLDPSLKDLCFGIRPYTARFAAEVGQPAADTGAVLAVYGLL